MGSSSRIYSHLPFLYFSTFRGSGNAGGETAARRALPRYPHAESSQVISHKRCHSQKYSNEKPAPQFARKAELAGGAFPDAS